MHDDEEFSDVSARPNKEQLKRETQALKLMVLQLIELPLSKLEGLSIAESIHSAIVAAKKMERTALKRQIKYIVGLLREVDIEVLGRELYLLAQPHKKDVQAFHELEQWRDALIGGGDAVINQVLERFDTADRQQLRQLVRNARKEKEQNKPPRAARMLFRYLTELQQGS